MTYDIILADPAWKFASNSKAKPGRNAMRHYPCMTDAEIRALPVGDWAAKDALLLMWTTAPMLERSLAVPRAWGFRYKSQLIWVKNHIGTGFWARNRHEIVLICTRGKFPCQRPAPFPDSVITGQQREHSRKPDALHEMIDRAWPDARKLEMFARQARLGWDAWGNEVGKFSEEELPKLHRCALNGTASEVDRLRSPHSDADETCVDGNTSQPASALQGEARCIWQM